MLFQNYSLYTIEIVIKGEINKKFRQVKKLLSYHSLTKEEKESQGLFTFSLDGNSEEVIVFYSGKKIKKEGDFASYFKITQQKSCFKINRDEIHVKILTQQKEDEKMVVW